MFEGNRASNQEDWRGYNSFKQGGGLHVFGEAEVALGSDYFFNNGAEHGGAVVMRGNLTVQVEHCVFESNVANALGGGVTLTVRVAVIDWFVVFAAFSWVVGCAAACDASLLLR